MSTVLWLVIKLQIAYQTRHYGTVKFAETLWCSYQQQVLVSAQTRIQRLGLCILAVSSFKERCTYQILYSLALNSSRRLATVVLLSANILAQSTAALRAPALPTARVPTGSPAGICTML